MSRITISRKALTSVVWLAIGGVSHANEVASNPDMPLTSNPSADEFIAPKKPLVLTRTVRRSLSDGNEIISERSYDIRFTPENGGYRIDGQLHDVRVDAPARLAALASLERNRRDDSVFPLRVNATGQITSPQTPLAKTSGQTAASLVNTMVKNAQLVGPDQQAINKFVEQITSMAGGAPSVWPNDLFRPAAGKRSETHTMPLPAGGKGKVTVMVDAKTLDDSGLLQSMERTIITETEGQQRLSREIWTLSQVGR